MYANSSSLNKAVTINLKSGDNYTLESSTAIAQARFLTNTAGPRYTISGIVIPKPEI